MNASLADFTLPWFFGTLFGSSVTEHNLASRSVGSPDQPHGPSISIEHRWDDVRRDLNDAIAEASDSLDSGGEQTKPVLRETKEFALALIRALPSMATVPEISVHADGEIAFYWKSAPGWVLSLAVGPTGRLSYAAMLGPRRYHATEYFIDGLSSALTEHLQKLHAKRDRITV